MAVVVAQNEPIQSMIRELQACAQRILCESRPGPPLSAYEAALYAAIEAEARDGTSRMHLARVGLYAEEIARQAGLPPERRKLILLCSPLHDIGKMEVPEAVLCKPGALDPGEREAMQGHCLHGSRLLAQLCAANPDLPDMPAPVLELAQQIVLTHHERFDGRGYPKGLAGEAIPLESRIVAVADVFDALTTKRPYRAALDDHQALEVMMLEQGSRFDQAVFDAFLDCFDRIRSIRRHMHPES